MKSASPLDNSEEVQIPRSRRMFIVVDKADFEKSMKTLIESEGFRHLSAVTGIDAGSEIELIYHLTRRDLVLSLKVEISKENPIISSIVNLIPGAVLYEREVHDLLGVVFEGNPDPSPLLLADEWPSGVHPLRREWPPQDALKPGDER